MKTCSKCKESKDESLFGKNRASKDGLHCICKCCTREKSSKWRAENPDKSRANSAEWRAKNPDRARENGARYKAEHPDKSRANSAEWRAKNPDKVRAARAKWNAENPIPRAAIVVRCYCKQLGKPVTPEIIEVLALSCVIKRHIRKSQNENNRNPT